MSRWSAGPSDDALRAGLALSTGLAPTAIKGRMPPSDTITTFQAGHGFSTSASPDPATNLNDTTVFSLGTQSVKVVTLGLTTVGVQGLPAVDFTGKNIRLRLRGENLAHMDRIEVYAGTGTLDNRYVWGSAVGDKWWGLYIGEVNPSVNYSKDGEWVDIDLSWADVTATAGTPNRASIDSWQLRVTGDGVQKVTVNWQAIYAVPQSPTYPNGVVSFTFDDNSLGQITYAKPRLDQYGFLATYYIILDLLGATVGGDTYFSLEQAHELYEQGHDVAPHCTTLARHSAAGALTALTEADREQEFRDLKAWQYEQGFARSADHFATPQGMFDPALIRTMRKYFASHRTTNYFTQETVRPSDAMRLRSVSLPAAGTTVTLAMILAAIDKAYDEGSWLIFMGHKIVTGTSANSLECTQADWNTICDYVATKGIPVAPVSEVLSNM